MAPSKCWMKLAQNDRLNVEYEIGVEDFISYAIEKTRDERIRCPCIKCKNSVMGSKQTVKDHLIVWGIIPSYTFWYHHGERAHMQENEVVSDYADEVDNDEDLRDNFEAGDEISTLLGDIFPNRGNANEAMVDDLRGNAELEEEPNDDAKKFYRLLEGFNKPLFEGSRSSMLSATLNLLQIKTVGKWSNESFTSLSQYLNGHVLPPDSTLPSSYYDTKKFIKDLGLSYQKIDACVNDCMLFWKKTDKKLDACKVCGASRWKKKKDNEGVKSKKNGKKIPHKTLRYFPLKPRLQRLFMCSKTASDMTWHHDKRANDGVMRHPADSKGWKHFDEVYESFSADPRNVRLGLVSDGFQPFSKSSNSYSIWPVMLIPYNMPPWICMKQSNFILSMLIPGPSGPGDAIDVYLQPLVEELKELWENGVGTYDAARRKNFKLHAALLYTINDFPAYANLSGWSTKGKLACPSCHTETHSMRLSKSSKQVYMKHRRFLPINHPLRKKVDLYGKKEKCLPPKPLSGDEVLQQVQDLDGNILSKDPNKHVKVSHQQRGDNWNKKSIFFDLPYWKTLLLRHNLDVMHIEKNVCDIVLGTLMNSKGKKKEINSRLDMKNIGIMSHLHLKEDGKRIELAHAPYNFTKEEKLMFCQFLKGVRVPDGFSSNISSCVNVKECKIMGLKSHDNHVLIQRLLPLALRGLLVKDVSEPLIELCMFFKILCAKSLRMEDLEQIKTQIPVALSKLENWLPPSCFDVMLHLVVHLADEAIIYGPVYYRWMYPAERYLFTLKSYIRNNARPEGSIAEGYLANECITLCSRYLHSVDTKFNRSERNYDGGSKDGKRLSIFSHPGRPLGAAKARVFDIHEKENAHIYVLKNCDEVGPFYEEFRNDMHMNGVQLDDEEMDRQFPKWFKGKVDMLEKYGNCPYGEEFISLARGPTQFVKSYSGYVTGGFRYHTNTRDAGLKTQNSGVVVHGVEGVDYYGILTEVISLQYLGGNCVVLFRCNWFDVNDSKRGIRTDRFGFVSVDVRRRLKTNELFVLASQASQVFYVTDFVNKGSWHLVIKTSPRDMYDMTSRDDDADDDCNEDNLDNSDDPEDAYQDDESFNLQVDESRYTHMERDYNWDQNSAPEIINVSSVSKKRKRRNK